MFRKTEEEKDYLSRGNGNMTFLVITFGISGSGKTTVSKQYEKEGFIRVSPDDLRKEMTGSISDLSKDKEVFDSCFYKTYSALKNGKNVIFDSTALNYITRKRIQKIAYKANASPSLLVFCDSKNKELCRSRVKEDLSNGIDRSNTDKDDIFDKQYQSFIENLEFLEDEGFDGVIYEER